MIETKLFELNPATDKHCLAIVYEYGQKFIVTSLKINDIRLPNFFYVDRKKNNIKGNGNCYKVITSGDLALIHYLNRSGY